jgi:hypothetical protein
MSHRLFNDFCQPQATHFTDDMPGNGWFRAFFRRNTELPTCTGESVTSSSATIGKGYQKVV